MAVFSSKMTLQACPHPAPANEAAGSALLDFLIHMLDMIRRALRMAPAVNAGTQLQQHRQMLRTAAIAAAFAVHMRIVAPLSLLHCFA